VKSQLKNKTELLPERIHSLPIVCASEHKASMPTRSCLPLSYNIGRQGRIYF
jgi:hypothetical protein